MKFLTIPAILLCVAVGSYNPSTPAAPVEVPSEVITEPAPEPVKTVTRWVLANASQAEAIVLDALQDRGITDRNALATVLGNIKQESKFNANICEGGARVSYWGCRYGGYGLIQWTTSSRYRGLGSHASAIGLDPSTIHAQVSFIFQETQWQRIEPSLMQGGGSINYYMNKAYYWLGWGIHGARTQYAFDYANRLSTIEVPVNEQG